MSNEIDKKVWHKKRMGNNVLFFIQSFKSY